MSIDLKNRVAVAVQLGKQEADRFNREPNTADLIIGIMKEGGHGCRVLESLGLDLRTVRDAIERQATEKAYFTQDLALARSWVEFSVNQVAMTKVELDALREQYVANRFEFVIDTLEADEPTYVPTK